MFPSMRVIVFASQKGGSGKTTLSGHIAVEAERQGAGPVASDRYRSAGLPCEMVERAQRPCSQLSFNRFFLISSTISTAPAKKALSLVVIDTPPAVTRAISEVVSFADIVVAPTRPSPHDLRAVGPTVDIAEARGKPLIFVVNAATQRARITSEAAIALSQHGTVAPTTIHHRVDFAASMIDGRTVMEIDPFCQSSQEISALWNYLHDRLQRSDGGHRSQDEPASAASNPHSRVFGRRAV